MVSSVSSIPYYSYLSQLQGGQTAAASTTASNTTTSGNNDSASLVSSLLGTGGFSPSVLSLLQENGSGQFDPIANILGGQSADSGLTKLFSNLYNTQTAATLQTAKLDNAKPAAFTSPIDGLINSATQASTAYNQTLQQNAASALKAGEAKTNSVISVIS